jgi:hypothetical protein
MQSAFDYSPITISSIACKLYNTFFYGIDSLSPWCLAYITFEKFISIAYSEKFFKRKKTQIVFFLLLCLYNFIFHVNIPFSVDILIKNNITVCDFVDNKWKDIIIYLDIVNCVLGPFFIMISFASLLIGAIFKVRRRVNFNNNEREKRRLKQDIKFVISLFTMILFFIILQSPIEYATFLTGFPFSDIYILTSYAYFLTYSINFYILILTNNLFRKEFFTLFLKKKHQTRNEIIDLARKAQNLQLTITQSQTQTQTIR